MTHSFRWSKTPKFYINLARRPDRAKRVEEEFDKHNLDVSWWPAQDWQETTVPSDSIKLSEPNAAGILACAMSHISLIRHARDNGFKAIVIFEDDIELSEDFADKIKYIEGIDEPWDMFYLGCHSYRSTPTKHENIFRVDVAAGTYAYIVKSSLYEFILSKWWYRYGWDEFLDYEVLKCHNVLAILPPIVTTFDGFSDVANHYVKYDLK
jgi:GR25 family glycosyltransferase involved in LPS biosynthesis